MRFEFELIIFKSILGEVSVLLHNPNSNPPAFKRPVVFTCDTIDCCSPLAIDLGRGRLDLLVGEEDGGVIYYPREQLTWVDMRLNKKSNNQQP